MPGIERAIGRQMLRMLSRQGLSSTKMISIARMAGGGYRYQDMLNDARKFTWRFKFEGNVASLGAESLVPKAWMVETELARPYRYRVFFDVTYYDPIENKIISGRRSMYTDDWLKRRGFEDRFQEVLPRTGTDPRYEVEGVSFRAIEHNTGWTY